MAVAWEAGGTAGGGEGGLRKYVQKNQLILCSDVTPLNPGFLRRVRINVGIDLKLESPCQCNPGCPMEGEAGGKSKVDTHHVPLTPRVTPAGSPLPLKRRKNNIHKYLYYFLYSVQRMKKRTLSLNIVSICLEKNKCTISS